MTVVLDASVIIKWLLQDPIREAGTVKATQIMQEIINGERAVLQPPHWLVEVGAVLARESAKTAVNDVTLLNALELPATDDPLILNRGVELAIELKQHLFDTLYHAVALEVPDRLLVTADERYLRVARGKGQILNLMEWDAGSFDRARSTP